MGWEVVGDPTKLNINMNGPDILFKSGNRVLAVELKLGDSFRNFSQSRLGWASGSQSWGGSLERLGSFAKRFGGSSNAQLRLMANTIKQASASGQLENALYATSEKVSEGVRGLFNGVYRVSRNGGDVTVDKALEPVRQGWGQSLRVWASAAAGSAAAATTQAGMTMRALGQALSVSGPPVPIIVPLDKLKDILDQFDPYSSSSIDM